MRLLLCLFLVAAFHLPAQDAPPALTEYMGRQIAMTMHWKGAEWLMRRVRDREEATTLMRKELRVKPGMVVCDMGCGNGYHTLPLAEMVGATGKVYAVDVQPEMIQMLKANMESKGVTNIVPINSLYHDPKLPPNTCDMILMVDVYHEFSHPVQMLAGMRAALKPDGLLVLAEYRAEDESVPIKPEHKMSKAQINKEMNANGFKLVREFDGLPWQHLMFFGKADAK
ncbi:class I SAM-dependent methyltransferase [Prosthecobacter sp.]|uniref:class I SAM-dependent methyltransferase n=1 Tax=Prosthecobacter sp. TaxID=1965333 RepID=UPI001D89FB7B|nr:class I SAM-dependent methyltransferase [Prosthecobacter sp.]MCB1275087.1 class I SAM-dependent methyltransferase [Prosthecobacter sp.]